jgi:hypothetical protein
VPGRPGLDLVAELVPDLAGDDGRGDGVDLGLGLGLGPAALSTLGRYALAAVIRHRKI